LTNQNKEWKKWNGVKKIVWSALLGSKELECNQGGIGLESEWLHILSGQEADQSGIGKIVNLMIFSTIRPPLGLDKNGLEWGALWEKVPSDI
jgi:hypothetical protein